MILERVIGALLQQNRQLAGPHRHQDEVHGDGWPRKRVRIVAFEEFGFLPALHHRRR